MDKKKLKIAILSRYQDTTQRGVEVFVNELSQRLAPHNVTILKGEDSDNIRLILQGDFDVVIPTNGRWQSLTISLARLLGRYKIIISGHSGIGRDDIWNIVIAKPDVFVALTEVMYNWAKKYAWGSKIANIPNGIDLDKFSPHGQKAKIGFTSPIILSVGALEWYKHHELTIQALSKIDNVALLILGSGSKYQYLKEMGHKLLGEKRFKIMAVSHRDIADYYRAASVFVLPSWNREAFGIVYLEAMACGLPVVAPNDESRKEIIEEGGILVNVENSDQYAKAISEALNTNWLGAPRKQAEKFSWDRIAGRYKELMEEITK